jgi:CASP2 and RIPK1 domain containing adaptor with death domain
MLLILQRVSSEQSAMNTRHQDKLRKLRVELVQEINALQLNDYLLQENILVSEDVEVILSKVTTKEKARTLIDIIPTRGPKAFDAFVAALKQYQHYDHLVKKLEEP